MSLTVDVLEVDYVVVDVIEIDVLGARRIRRRIWVLSSKLTYIEIRLSGQ
jgi:hypothetical protein